MIGVSVHQSRRSGIGVLAEDAYLRSTCYRSRAGVIFREQTLQRHGLVHKVGLRDHHGSVMLSIESKVAGNDEGVASRHRSSVDGIAIPNRRVTRYLSKAIRNAHRYRRLCWRHVFEKLRKQTEPLMGVRPQLPGLVSAIDKKDVAIKGGQPTSTARRRRIVLQDDDEVRPKVTLHLRGSGTLFNDSGKEHLFRHLEPTPTRFWETPGPFVKSRRKKVAVICKDLSGFAIQLLWVVIGHGFGRYTREENYCAKLAKVPSQDFRHGQV